MKLKSWNTEDIIYLKENYSINGRKFCSTKLNKTENQIKEAVKVLGLRVNYKKTSEEIKKELEKYNYFKDGNFVYGYKNCPKCNKKLKIKAQKESFLLRNIRNSENKNTICISCSTSGSCNPFFNKIHSKETINKISNSRKGKGCGKNNAMSKEKYRRKVSDALKEKYASGELDFLKKIQSETAKKNQELGILKNAPISKAEIEIKNELENKGLNVISQFNIGSLKYDLFVKDKNLLIEYNGDYWHCNPVKYNKNYVHKKKNKTAEEIWLKDKYKKKLAVENGFNFIVIWENDYNKNKEKEIKKILNK